MQCGVPREGHFSLISCIDSIDFIIVSKPYQDPFLASMERCGFLSLFPQETSTNLMSTLSTSPVTFPEVRLEAIPSHHHHERNHQQHASGRTNPQLWKQPPTEPWKQLSKDDLNLCFYKDLKNSWVYLMCSPNWCLVDLFSLNVFLPSWLGSQYL